jgi:hypothetical protein
LQKAGKYEMKKLYHLLKIALWCFVGIFIGSSIGQYFDYKKNSGLYAAQSVPWYLDIEIQGIFTVMIILALFIMMQIIKKKM